MRTSAPYGYLICDGSTYNIGDYPLLEELFTTDFGSVNYFGGDGTTTWKVPDLRGEFLRGTGTNSHSRGGAGSSVGTHQAPTVQLNFQTYGYGSSNTDVALGVPLGSSSFSASPVDTSTGEKNYRIIQVQKGQTTWDTNSTFTARPTNTAVLYCIRAY